MGFSAELTDVKTVYNVLKGIATKEFAVFRPLKEGLKVTLDEMRCVEISAYIPSKIFSTYVLTDDDDSDENNNMFKINLRIFTDILNIFGDDSNPSLKLTFNGDGAPLSLLMNHSEENITIDCEIKTLSINEFETPSLAEECDLNKIVINANIFVELLQRLDHSAEELQISFKPNFPYFTLQSKSLSGKSEVSLHKTSDSVTVYQCKKDTNFTYAFSNIRHIIKVLHFASKVSISSGEIGLLGLELVVNSNENQLYVECYVTAQFIED